MTENNQKALGKGKDFLEKISYRLSKYRYKELYYYCLQYAEFKRHQDIYSTALIEQTAIEAGGCMYTYLLESVTNERVALEDLTLPCNLNRFKEIRRKFYYLLNLKK